MKPINSGWGSVDGIPQEILNLIGWDEYIETATRPYPLSVLNTESNRAAVAKREKLDAERQARP